MCNSLIAKTLTENTGNLKERSESSQLDPYAQALDVCGNNLTFRVLRSPSICLFLPLTFGMETKSPIITFDEY